MSQGRTIISRGLEEVKNNKEVGNAYLGNDLPAKNQSDWW
jgi:ABC-type branched-subunit amino acid transport system ATPase component